MLLLLLLLLLCLSMYDMSCVCVFVCNNVERVFIVNDEQHDCNSSSNNSEALERLMVNMSPYSVCVLLL